MKFARHDFTKFGFVKTFVCPALLIFLLPVLSLLFFRHAERELDARAREAALRQIRSDPRLSDEDRSAGIDDNFFVAESPIMVGGEEYRGQTLFVSLALLRHLNSQEAPYSFSNSDCRHRSHR